MKREFIQVRVHTCSMGLQRAICSGRSIEATSNAMHYQTNNHVSDMRATNHKTRSQRNQDVFVMIGFSRKEMPALRTGDSSWVHLGGIRATCLRILIRMWGIDRASKWGNSTAYQALSYSHLRDERRVRCRALVL